MEIGVRVVGWLIWGCFVGSRVVWVGWFACRLP